MKTFIVHFIEDSYTFNEAELRTSPGERRFVFRIQANTAEEAYLLGVEKVRARTKLTFRLNSCRVAWGSPRADEGRTSNAQGDCPV